MPEASQTKTPVRNRRNRGSSSYDPSRQQLNDTCLDSDEQPTQVLETARSVLCVHDFTISWLYTHKLTAAYVFLVGVWMLCRCAVKIIYWFTCASFFFSVIWHIIGCSDTNAKRHHIRWQCCHTAHRQWRLCTTTGGICTGAIIEGKELNQPLYSIWIVDT